MCMAPWSTHGSKTGGYFTCNIYEKVKNNPDELDKITAKEHEANELKRYSFHYERYNNHRNSLKQLDPLRKDLEMTFICHMVESYHYQVNQMTFFMDAINAIEKAKRVLRWTYVYGFYCKSQIEETLLSDIQGRLEQNCEVLYAKVEKLDKQRYMSNEMEARGEFE